MALSPLALTCHFCKDVFSILPAAVAAPFLDLFNLAAPENVRLQCYMGTELGGLPCLREKDKVGSIYSVALVC